MRLKNFSSYLKNTELLLQHEWKLTHILLSRTAVNNKICASYACALMCTITTWQFSWGTFDVCTCKWLPTRFSTLSSIRVRLKKPRGEWADSSQTSQTFLWVLKASWSILESIWQSCLWARGEAALQVGVDMCRQQMFLGQVSHVMGACVWLWAGYGGSIVFVTVFSRRRPLCLPFTSWAPASVKSMLITSSKLQLGSDEWLSWPTWCNIRFRTSSREAAVSSSRIVALARKPSRSRCARTSSSKFISFTYCGQISNSVKVWHSFTEHL